ncbi:hypothetical protein [Mycobacterium sp.]|uniref:hypothetical protein n=1 Tax=Mycobacterium sp. TaxID=1785 RepID=UPI002C090C1F|nr:hypothetical protein [Mycobacterium sp.]HTY35393.1 hypothetical protein [Mycobacterium sp.]
MTGLAVLDGIRVETDHRPDHLGRWVDLAWRATGPAGSVQFTVTRYPPGTAMHEHASQFRDLYSWDRDGSAWHASDVGYHSPTPRYDGQEPFSDSCTVLGGVCYYDGSGLRASEWASDLVWLTETERWQRISVRLRSFYRECFDGEMAIVSPMTALIYLMQRAGAAS